MWFLLSGYAARVRESRGRSRTRTDTILTRDGGGTGQLRLLCRDGEGGGDISGSIHTHPLILKKRINVMLHYRKIQQEGLDNYLLGLTYISLLIFEFDGFF